MWGLKICSYRLYCGVSLYVLLKTCCFLTCAGRRLPDATSLFDRDYWEERYRYQALCRGDKGAVKLTPPRAAKLKCKYHHGNKPRLLLSPGKLSGVMHLYSLLRTVVIVTLE